MNPNEQPPKVKPGTKEFVILTGLATSHQKTHIQIDDDFAIGADSYSWHILKRVDRKRDGNLVTEWVAVKWATTLKGIIHIFADYTLRISGASTLDELQKEQEKVLAALCKALHPKYKVELAA